MLTESVGQPARLVHDVRGVTSVLDGQRFRHMASVLEYYVWGLVIMLRLNCDGLLKSMYLPYYRMRRLLMWQWRMLPNRLGV